LKKQKKCVILKAIVNNRIVGSVRVRKHNNHCYIGRLFVHPAYQNNGVGKHLMCTAEKVFDVPRYELVTGNLDEKNIVFYTNLGYKIYSKEKAADNLYYVHMEKLATGK